MPPVETSPGTTPSRPRGRNRLLVGALYANAAGLLLIALGLFARGGSGDWMPAAFAQNQPPIAGGAGVFVMPAQFHTNTFGCYLLDVDSQTLCVYQWFPGEKNLRLMASRHFRHDRRLHNFNTTPSPREVEELVNKEREAVPPPAQD